MISTLHSRRTFHHKNFSDVYSDNDFLQQIKLTIDRKTLSLGKVNLISQYCYLITSHFGITEYLRL